VVNGIIQVAHLPSKANLLADARVRLPADLGGDGMVGFEVVCKVLRKNEQIERDTDLIVHTASFHLIGTPVQ
jgi:hypothetical protein